MKKVVDNTVNEVKETPKHTLTDDERKDVRLIVLELQNLGLQIQALQSRANEMTASARAFESALLKRKELSADEYTIDYQNLELKKKT